MKKVGADELTLRLREALVSCEGILHFRGAPFEYCGEVAVPVVEVSQRFGKQRVGLVRGHCEDAVDDVIGAGLVDGMQVSGFDRRPERSEEHTSELQSLMRISYAVFCLKKKNTESSTILDNTLI